MRPRASTPTLLLLSAGLAAGCGSGEAGPGDGRPAPAPPADTAAPPPATPAPAPWSSPALDPSAVAAPYLAAWRDAENRGWCPLLAFEDPGAGFASDVRPTPREATFGGGWGVAWDLPELRSAFGVAGTGVRPGAGTYDDWPHRIQWADGSRAGYGPEGGRGPRQLAYLRVQGAGCLYNVWSRIGLHHLERILGQLRWVETGGE